MEKVLIIDYGSQYTQLIARRIRENHVYSEVVSGSVEIDLSQVKGLILSGGPSSVYEDDAPKLPVFFDEILRRGIPVLGICYGLHLITYNLGGEVKKVEQSEYGKTDLNLTAESRLFDSVDRTFSSWMSHGDSVTSLPEGFEKTAMSKSGILAGMENVQRKIYCIQFHPEVKHTQFGEAIISNFLFKICGCSPSWNLEDYVEDQISKIKEKVGDSTVISAFSGGVDSSVASLIVHKAIGKNLMNVFVDHGMLRKNEEEEVPAIFEQALGMNFRLLDCREAFLSRLEGVEDPEMKRKIIGEQFIREFESFAKQYPTAKFLVQGTIYSDVIESAGTTTGKTAKIKSHHNVGGLPENMDMELIEPLRTLFKDEVRQLGEILGIPHHIVYRHPFPGPGLAVRCLGEITKQKLAVLKEADFIFREVLREYGWEEKVWQAFAVILPVRSVGVIGDRRSYGYTIALRSVDSVEAMTADWSRIPHEILDEASRRITNKISAVGRVVYDITSKPPATIEWE